MECAKCRKPFINRETAILTFNLGRIGVAFCEKCGRRFKELKNVINEKYHENLEKAYEMYIEAYNWRS
jgi:hypothetical protein